MHLSVYIGRGYIVNKGLPCRFSAVTLSRIIPMRSFLFSFLNVFNILCVTLTVLGLLPRP
jgi:hypothetical protein